MKAAVPAPPIGVARHAGALADDIDPYIAVEDLPVIVAAVAIAAAGEGSHRRFAFAGSRSGRA